MKRVLFLFFILARFNSYSQIDSPNHYELIKVVHNDSIYKYGTIDTSYIAKYGMYTIDRKLPNGVWLVYYKEDSSKVYLKARFRNGVQEGLFRLYWLNGNIWVKGNFKNGLADGERVIYNERGKIAGFAYWKEGKETGTWIYYDDKGNKIREDTYQNGVLIKVSNLTPKGKAPR
jgi:antitoxin component YwqK of YwqJK toxin-antitoxin module